MFKRDARSDAPTDGRSSTRRRDGRGLGPFSGGQLTMIIVTIALVVGFPVAASAVTGSNSFITDFTSGTHAKVDAKQNVATALRDPVSGLGASVTNGPGSLAYLHTTSHIADFSTNTPAKVDAKNNLNTAIHDSATGVAAKVNGLGQLSVAATGSVNAVQAAPSNLFVAIGNGQSNNFQLGCAFFTPIAGMAAVITSIDVSPDGGAIPSGSSIQAIVASDTASSCGGSTTWIMEDTLTSVTPYTHSLGVGIGLQTGHFLDLQIASTGGASPTTVTVHGYYVPAAQCSTGCL
jgi:hypothetical protein